MCNYDSFLQCETSTLAVHELTMNIHVNRFLVGTAGISWGFPVTQIYVVSTYSKLLGSKKQGLWMGLLTAGSAAARMVGPLWSTATYDHLHMYLIFAVLAGLLFFNTSLCIILFSCGFISRNMPPPITIK